MIDFVELENLQADVRQVELNAAVFGSQRLRERAGRIDEPAVVDQIGEVQRGEVAGQGIQGKQDDQHQAQPQQQSGA